MRDIIRFDVNFDNFPNRYFVDVLEISYRLIFGGFNIRIMSPSAWFECVMDDMKKLELKKEDNMMDRDLWKILISGRCLTRMSVNLFLCL